ncbi:uncharacterized protein LOC127277438 [Leptopilina boulardi]|uniref:uncharacterized protein LOC127277438 n=1 Tax=Leptopilina boulardi TaxID=63433 RepID=UPI0021F63AE4|nr:uncharacterized protein LOC127277438 [Leptopilina boulardi]
MNTSVFIQQSSEFQFLSVCHYITIFGVYFYNNDLITLDERSQSVPILNTLFEYLNNSQDESEAKLQLLKKVLKGSDFYGGEEYETLDMKYVDATYQYIISKALFSHYGNINGYLAKIINSADDVNYSALKEKVFQHLSENYTTREYCFNNIPLRNYDSDNNPLGNYNSDNNPFGNYDSDNNPIGNNDLKNIPIGNYSSNNNTLGNYSSNSTPLENFDSNSTSLRNYGSNNNSSGNNTSNNIPSGNSSKLNGLTIKKVFNDHIWPIFPQPEQDMSIMEVNYIYAMVGLKIIKSVSATSPNLTFHEYILISREIDLQNFSNETYEMVLNLFSTPALFFYAYNQKAKFQKIDNFTLTDELLIEAYKNLFSHIKFTMEKFVKNDIENSLHYKLKNEINTLKSRTFYAYEILRLYCNYKNVAQISPVYVNIYKTLYLWMTKSILPTRCQKEDFPDLKEIYEKQFKNVEELYNKIERIAIEKVLVDSNLTEKMNSNSVILARVPDYPQRCTYCSPTPRKTNNDIYLLFAIKKLDFYALRQEDNVLSLLTNKGNEQKFAKAVANDSSLRMEIAVFSQTLKYSNEDYRGFIARVAEIKTKQFVDNLISYYYDETIGEKYLNFLKSLIPFYSCIESAKAGRMAESAFSCSMDVLSLIPFAGFLAKYTARLTNSFAVEIGNKYLITNTLARTEITKLPIITVLNQISQTAVKTIAKEILTRSLLKDLTVASLRTVDPGFEFVYQVSRFGFKVFRDLFRSIVENFKNIRSVKIRVGLIKSLLTNANRMMHLVSDQTGLVPLILARHNRYNIVRYFYPGGSNFFGPTCLTSFGNTAELRIIEGYSFPLPVVREGNYYKEYMPETGKIGKAKLKMDNNNDILRKIGYLLEELVAEGQDLNGIHNYHVYHNTINWKKIVKDEQKSVSLNQPLTDIPQHQFNTEVGFRDLQNSQSLNPHSEIPLGNTIMYSNPQFSNLEMQYNLGGNVEVSNLAQVTNMEYFGNFMEDPKSELPGTSNQIVETFSHSKTSAKPLTVYDVAFHIPKKRRKLNENIPPTIRKVDVLSNEKKTSLYYQSSIVDPDDIPGTSKQFSTSLESLNNQKIGNPNGNLNSNLRISEQLSTSPELSIENRKIMNPIANSRTWEQFGKVSENLANNQQELVNPDAIPGTWEQFGKVSETLANNQQEIVNPNEIFRTSEQFGKVSETLANNQQEIVNPNEIFGTSEQFGKVSETLANNQQEIVNPNEIFGTSEQFGKVSETLANNQQELVNPDAITGTWEQFGKVSETLANNQQELVNPDAIPGTSEQFGKVSETLANNQQEIVNPNEIFRTSEQFGKVSETFVNNHLELVNPDDIPGTSRQFEKILETLKQNKEIVNSNSIPKTPKHLLSHLYPNDYIKILTKSKYDEYTNILLFWKKNGLPIVKLEREKLNTLRNCVNKLALLQLDHELPFNYPRRLWYTQIITGKNNINFLKRLKGKYFFFNDITLLKTEPPGIMKKMKNYNLEVEVRYHLTIDSSYGFVDLTHFHSDFKYNYMTFNDVIFKVTDTFLTPNEFVLNIQLKYEGLSNEYWRNLRMENLNDLKKEEIIIETTRMKMINKAANFLAEYSPLCTYKLSRNHLLNFILSTKSIGMGFTPTYSALADDIKNMRSQRRYEHWRIESNRYIQDILSNLNLDKIIQLSEANRRIAVIYNSIHFQNVREVFENFRKIPNIEQKIRFEDYYALYSLVKEESLLTNSDGIRRFEAAINRLGLRQSDEEFVKEPITLYRCEMINKDLSSKLRMALKKKDIIEFGKYMKFSSNRQLEEKNWIKSSTQIPLLMELKLLNQVGVVDFSRVLTNQRPFHMAISKFEFLLDEIRTRFINHRKVLVMKLSDSERTTEIRMIQMANKLNELFSTETKFYSDDL